MYTKYLLHIEGNVFYSNGGNNSSLFGINKQYQNQNKEQPSAMKSWFL